MITSSTKPDDLILQLLRLEAPLGEEVPEADVFSKAIKNLGETPKETLRKYLTWLELEGFIEWKEGLTIKLLFEPKAIIDPSFKPQ